MSLPEQNLIEADQLKADVDAAIEAWGGDLRATIGPLLMANAYLEQELELTAAAVSHGYSRGWHAKRFDQSN